MSSSSTTTSDECRCACGKTQSATCGSGDDADEEGSGPRRELTPAGRRADARRPRCAASVVRWPAWKSRWLLLLMLLAMSSFVGAGSVYEAAINSPKSGGEFLAFCPKRASLTWRCSY
ncbi:hypothetical protein QAD02_014400 [Eretmocerus hayati]|uniref:Uncharacterized protein n=1 Tax=Eretmocerus hayati TaxID=131215 RepID=A0ACC2P687_9HYME|nr:hypothetical protein QAD02_014400 [Eretmocerus hayati]